MNRSGRLLAVCVTLALVVLNASAQNAEYSWQQAHAQVLPGGDLKWKPAPFAFEPGASARYIDFAGGSDSNSGQTKALPWKHHPWDPAARGVAAACTGVHTYVFKRGVAYRGAHGGPPAQVRVEMPGEHGALPVHHLPLGADVVAHPGEEKGLGQAERLLFGA